MSLKKTEKITYSNKIIIPEICRKGGEIFSFLIQIPSLGRERGDKELEVDWKGIRTLTVGINKVLISLQTFTSVFPLLSVQFICILSCTHLN